MLLAILGFLPPDDARLVATIDAVERELSDERGLLYRYRGEDGLAGTEGTFLLCTFWLAHALAVTGQLDRAATVLDRAAGYATDLGLFAEQIDTDHRRAARKLPPSLQPPRTHHSRSRHHHRPRHRRQGIQAPRGATAGYDQR